jgi:putative membrane protein
MSKTNWITVAVITLLVFLVLMFGAMMLGIGSYQNVGPVWMRDFMPLVGPMMMFMCLIPIVFIVLVVLGVFLLMQARDTDETRKTETPLEILKKRYASGEITKKEFDQMREDLEDRG